VADEEQPALATSRRDRGHGGLDVALTVRRINKRQATSRGMVARPGILWHPRWVTGTLRSGEPARSATPHRGAAPSWDPAGKLRPGREMRSMAART